MAYITVHRQQRRTPIDNTVSRTLVFNNGIEQDITSMSLKGAEAHNIQNFEISSNGLLNLRNPLVKSFEAPEHFDSNVINFIVPIEYDPEIQYEENPFLYVQSNGLYYHNNLVPIQINEEHEDYIDPDADVTISYEANIIKYMHGWIITGISFTDSNSEKTRFVFVSKKESTSLNDVDYWEAKVIHAYMPTNAEIMDKNKGYNLYGDVRIIQQSKFSNYGAFVINTVFPTPQKSERITAITQLYSSVSAATTLNLVPQVEFGTNYIEYLSTSNREFAFTWLKTYNNVLYKNVPLTNFMVSSVAQSLITLYTSNYGEITVYPVKLTQDFAQNMALFALKDIPVEEKVTYNFVVMELDKDSFTDKKHLTYDMLNEYPEVKNQTKRCLLHKFSHNTITNRVDPYEFTIYNTKYVYDSDLSIEVNTNMLDTEVLKDHSTVHSLGVPLYFNNRTTFDEAPFSLTEPQMLQEILSKQIKHWYGEDSFYCGYPAQKDSNLNEPFTNILILNTIDIKNMLNDLTETDRQAARITVSIDFQCIYTSMIAKTDDEFWSDLKGLQHSLDKEAVLYAHIYYSPLNGLGTPGVESGYTTRANQWTDELPRYAIWKVTEDYDKGALETALIITPKTNRMKSQVIKLNAPVNISQKFEEGKRYYTPEAVVVDPTYGSRYTKIEDPQKAITSDDVTHNLTFDISKDMYDKIMSKDKSDDDLVGSIIIALVGYSPKKGADEIPYHTLFDLMALNEVKPFYSLCVAQTTIDVSEDKDGLPNTITKKALNAYFRNSKPKVFEGTVNPYPYSISTPTTEAILDSSKLPFTQLCNKGISHKTQLVLYGEGQTVHVSEAAVPDYFPTAKAIDFDEKVTGLINYRNVMIASTLNKLWLCSQDIETLLFTRNVINSELGVDEFDSKTLCVYLNAIIFKKGSDLWSLRAESLSYSETNQSFNIRNMTEKVKEVLLQLDAANPSQVLSFITPESYNLVYTYSRLISPNMPKVVVLKMYNRGRDGVFTKLTYNLKDEAGILKFVLNGLEPYVLGGSGTTYKLDVNYRRYADLFNKLAYGDYPKYSLAELLKLNDSEKEDFYIECFNNLQGAYEPIEYELDTGNSLIGLKDRCVFTYTDISLNKLGFRPMDITVKVYIDGHYQEPVKDSTIVVTSEYDTFNNVDNLFLDESMLLQDSIIESKDIKTAIKNVIIKYRGKGSSVRHIISGKSRIMFSLNQLSYWLLKQGGR